MTNKNYYTSSNYATINPIPTRDEFHKYTSNLISISDFETDHSNGIQVEKVLSSINWAKKLSRKENK